MIWELQGSAQQHQEVHRKGKGKLDRWTVWWDWGKPEDDQQREGIPTRERLDYREIRESYYCPRSLRKMPYGRTGDTKPMDRIVLWGVQSQDQWRSINSELSPDRDRGRPARPSQRSEGCSTINEEESQLEVTLSKQNWSKQVEKQSFLLSRRQSATQIWQTEE